MNPVWRAKVISNFVIPDVGPVQLDGYSVVVEGGETFWWASRHEARELIALCGFAEKEIRRAYHLSGRLGVIRWLIRHGEIDPDDIQVDQNAQALGRQYSVYLADRRRQHGNWATGRKSMSY